LIVHLPAHGLQATDLLVIALPVLQATDLSVIVHHVLPVTVHSVDLRAQRVVQQDQVAVDSIPVPWAVVWVVLFRVAEAATLDNAAIAPTEKAQFVVLMPLRAMVRDVAKVLRRANQAR
jgi:hypothetical protein